MNRQQKHCANDLTPIMCCYTSHLSIQSEALTLRSRVLAHLRKGQQCICKQTTCVQSPNSICLYVMCQTCLLIQTDIYKTQRETDIFRNETIKPNFTISQSTMIAISTLTSLQVPVPHFLQPLQVHNPSEDHFSSSI